MKTTDSTRRPFTGPVNLHVRRSGTAIPAAVFGPITPVDRMLCVIAQRLSSHRSLVYSLTLAPSVGSRSEYLVATDRAVTTLHNQ